MEDNSVIKPLPREFPDPGNMIRRKIRRSAMVTEPFEVSRIRVFSGSAMAFLSFMFPNDASVWYPENCGKNALQGIQVNIGEEKRTWRFI